MTIEIHNDAAGVPYATLHAECLPFHISLSHSRDHALCAATMYAIGANIEWVESRTSKFVNDYFTANEIVRVNASAVETRNLVIHAIWSAKKAALQARHKGLRVDTRAVEIALAPFERAPTEWTLLQIQCSAGFVPPLQGWWRVQGDFVLTLAANLHTLPDATELLPETCLVTHAPVRHAHTPHRIGHTPHHAAHHEN